MQLGSALTEVCEEAYHSHCLEKNIIIQLLFNSNAGVSQFVTALRGRNLQ